MRHWELFRRLSKPVAASFFGLSACILFTPALCRAFDVTLAWDANRESVAGYRLYYGLASRGYDHKITVREAPVNGVVTKTVSGLLDQNTYYFAVKAFDAKDNESGFSNEVSYTPPETITKPRAVVGPTSLQAGVFYVFNAAGAVSNKGDAVEYRFLWGDGTGEAWVPAGSPVSKSWRGGTYQVRVQARCAAHPDVISDFSDPTSVTVSRAPAETISQPSVPAGASAVTDTAQHTYATGGAVSSASHPVEYRFLWADGTASPWLPAGQQETSRAWNLPGTYAVRSEARCRLHPTVHSAPSDPLDVSVSADPGEVFRTPPTAPSGPGDGITGTVYGYTTGAASQNTGDPVQYRFQWGDGTVSPWLTPGASGTASAWKSWSKEGIYSVVAEARCALHPGAPAISGPSTILMISGDSLLLADSFSDGTVGGDPQWQTLSGRWLVGSDGTFTSASRKATNRAVVRALPQFRTGRISTMIMTTPTVRPQPREAGIVFALRDTQHYRFVSVVGSRLVLGQVGDTAAEKAGVKASAVRAFKAGEWYRIRVDMHPDGRVLVFLGNATKPVLSHRFADTVAGRIGALAQQSVVHFDDYRVWDARALP